MREEGNAPGWGGELNPLDDPEERQHLFSVLDSFRYVERFDCMFQKWGGIMNKKSQYGSLVLARRLEAGE